MDFKLELITVPVSDVDRARDFYVENAGFNLDVDFSAGDDFRVVQLTPPGSACSIVIMRNTDGAAGSLQGLQLVVADIDAARAELIGRGTEASDVFHFEAGVRTPGYGPERADYETFFSFSDPDGTGWLVQEVRGAQAAASA